MCLRVHNACGGLYNTARRRNPSLCPHRFWRNPHIFRFSHRHRLQIPLQRIIPSIVVLAEYIPPDTASTLYTIHSTPIIMHLQLYRNAPQGTAITGRLFINDHYFCNTLERVGYEIPPSSYPILVTMSPKFKRLLPLVQNVPQRSGIRIHRGIRPEHSTGCILVSANKETELTNLLLKTQNNHETITLKITNSAPAALNPVISNARELQKH